MFSTTRRTDRHVFYFLHRLFLLYACTTLFTIGNALQHNDNEAIIQLSLDSIHVVKSADSRFANIEENINDNEEKDLLLALLTSFDDDSTNSIQVNADKSIENQQINNKLPVKNCTSSSSVATTFSSSSSSSSIRLTPSALDFGEQSIAIPRMQTVMIINDDLEPLALYSLSGTTVQFYSSFFTEKILSPHGGNTSIHVYFLPRTLGITKSTFTIETNRGIFQYYVNGTGTANPFHLRPLIGATIPSNSSFEYSIHFYNPYHYSIDIDEIYTSDENLIIELLPYKSYRNRIRKTSEHEEQWHLQPYQMKAIGKIHYLGYRLDRLHGFYRIKTSSNDTIVVPVEINVRDDLSLYSNVDLLQFSPDGLVRSVATPITIPVYVINNGNTPVTITNIRVTTANIDYITIEYENVQIPVGIHRLNKVADLTIHPHLIPIDITRVHGSIQIYISSSSSDNEGPILQIPFGASILHGSLDYDRESTYFYIPSSSIEQTNEPKQECRPIRFINRFNVSMTIFNITSDKTELLSQYIKMKFFTPYVYAHPEQSTFPLCITILQRPLPSIAFINFEASLTLHTNLSFFHLPIHFYSGLLSLNLVTDKTNGGMIRNDTNPSEFFIASIPVQTSRTVKFILINTNPINLTIDNISVKFAHTTVQLLQIQLLNASASTTVSKSSSKTTPIVIPARHQAVFSLTIHATNEPSFYDEIITFKTRYETLIMNVKYRFLDGSIDLNNKVPLHIDVFPNRVGMIDLFLHNGLTKAADVTRMEFPTYGKCFSFAWNNTSPGRLLIESGRAHHIGKLTFNMVSLCDNVQIPSESTCYCGLNNHPEFKQRWDEHVSALNTYELDHVLVLKFQKLWKEWTSLVRKQRVETNIWLTTDQGNGSWPVTIGFVWPSVLEHMSSASTSRTPIVLNFHLTLINTTKTKNVIISNPSSTSLSYSVELISSYGDVKKRNSIGDDQGFNISTTSKLVVKADGIYKFTLVPNEHLILSVSYRPTLSSKQEIYFVVRNNLTIIESILLLGEGANGGLTVGNRNAGSSDIPLVLEMNENQYKLCSDYLTTDGTHENPILLKIIALRNTGNIKVIIHDVSFGSSKCSGQGFSVAVCSKIEIEPNERYDLHFHYQPDYTLAEIDEILVLNTNIGLVTLPIIVRIPQRVLAACYQTIPRPAWESRTSWLCILSVPIIIFIIFTAAVNDAKRLFNNYLARFELHRRVREEKNSTSLLADLTTPQEESNIRDRTDSRTSTSSLNAKKEISNHESKIKPDENKSKRSTTSMNGTKDNGDISSKVLRTSEASSTAIKLIATSPKAVPHKARRATMDNGPSKSSKSQHETTTKLPPLRAQKSANTDQHTPIATTPPASSITDDESEPFMVARSKRVPTKIKESINHVIPTKPTLINDVVVPSRTTPSPPPSQPSAMIVPKILISSDLADQQHYQSDLSQSTEPINDQQWHIVSSNRGQRKGASPVTHRQDPVDEPQTINKTNRSTSVNADFGRYVSQTELCIDEPIGANEWTQSSLSPINDIPSLMSIPTIPSSSVTANVPLKNAAIFPSAVTKEIESSPFLHHGPGPIQRPTKLACPSTQSSNIANSIQSPGTSDVLDQINHFIYDHNTNTTGTSTPHANHVSATSPVINDLTTPNISWTTFSPAEWPAKSDSSWPLTTLQSPAIPLAAHIQNPFALISTMNEYQRQTLRGESPVWSSALGTATPRYVSPSTRTQRASTWNDLFSSTVPSSTESTKPTSSSWLKFLSAPDPSATDDVCLNGQESRPINPFWNLSSLSNESVVPSSPQAQQQPTSSTWWSTSSSDENNNTNQLNHSTGDTATTRDQSRWDFAR